jgi:hypothetical protein
VQKEANYGDAVFNLKSIFIKVINICIFLEILAPGLLRFIAGIFLLLYSKTLDQVNRFHDKLVDMQKTALDHIANSKITVIPRNSPDQKLETES